MANMYVANTTVALYDTLGDEATCYICDLTELETIACTNEIISKVAKLKISD